MTSQSFLLVVRIDVSTAVEDAFNRWYTAEHLPEIVQVPGFRWGKRYRLIEDETFPPALDEQRYFLAVQAPHGGGKWR